MRRLDEVIRQAPLIPGAGTDAGTAIAEPACALAAHGAVKGDEAMGKYFIGWLLGVPAVVLVILYLIFG